MASFCAGTTDKVDPYHRTQSMTPVRTIELYTFNKSTNIDAIQLYYSDEVSRGPQKSAEEHAC
jgi:hypothetical protein